MRVGITATQKGLTERQRILVRHQLKILNCTELHHGDCIGGDEEIHNIAVEMGIPIVIHPPIKTNKRAFCIPYAKIEIPYDYLVRNRHIVDATEYLLGCPDTNKERLRSGTWSTLRYGRSIGRPLLVLGPYPN